MIKILTVASAIALLIINGLVLWDLDQARAARQAHVEMEIEKYQDKSDG
jgi:hypothetical protein